MTNPLLRDLRILDLSRLLPGPFCTLYLAQLGATVIKIEEPHGGDYARALSPEMFALINRGKQSVTLDLRKPEGVALLKRLAAGADVLIESFRPGVMDKLGCGYEALKTVNPKLVYAALTGYGHSGPYRDRAGHDMNYCAYAGALDQIGSAGGPPVLSNTQLADLAGGALTCAIGILAAVHGARASGQGCFVDAAMLDGTLALQVVALSTLRTLGHTQPRGTDMLTGALPNYSLYECADGKWFALGALEPKFWQAFCAAIGKPELGRKPMSPGPTAEAVRAEVSAVLKTRPRDEWERLLAPADACTSGIYTLEEALANEQVRARGIVENVNGKPAFASPLQFRDAATASATPAPELGADTAAVLATIGIDDAELARLRAAGVV
ncbi:Crotonobetainyl-CoA:carnitine CoA-transferase CaiB [Fontimonas thermophila]|uniref:Crotonobetainyl-CoA:carnitine CoA-transferase CaiB n=1 Tax=Fontimonas thermophila TaxID=1076937 RepID=A0A1I2IT43_9GAMM|nr:CaiB/BaiF CoA-transferase family protein [Fontimonas thermophila]SFF43691.1 Crotonobetainyl-CoA:carnitine CoA-transferase CaiB [Fontimonas thermophila]